MQISDVVAVEKWEAFLKASEFSNIFSSPDMISAFENSSGFEVYPLFAIENDIIFAAAFPVLVKIKTPLPEKYSNRLILYSTPVFEKSEKGIEGLKIILSKFRAIASKKALFGEIRNSESFDLPSFQAQNTEWGYIPYQNYIIDLSVGKDNLWDSLASPTRNIIKKGEKRGMQVREVMPEEVDTAVDLLEGLYKRKNIPFIDRSLFSNAYNLLLPKGLIRILCAEYENKMIGVRISLQYNKTIYDWFAASDNEFSNFYVNEGLAWNSICWGIDNGYKIFDFGGGAVKGQEYGPAKFKEKFKGELVEYGRYRCISNKTVFFLASKFYELRTKKKK